MSASEFLFVYGTLRRDHRRRLHPLLRPYCRFVGTATVQGRLYDLGRYPGLVTSTNITDRVHGELYQLTSAARAWTRLDAYEECDPADTHAEYRRLLLPVRMDDGNDINAWCYVYNRKATGLQRIIDGNYKNRQNPSTRVVPSPIRPATRRPLDRSTPE